MPFAGHFFAPLTDGLAGDAKHQGQPVLADAQLFENGGFFHDAILADSKLTVNFFIFNKHIIKVDVNLMLAHNSITHQKPQQDQTARIRL